MVFNWFQRNGESDQSSEATPAVQPEPDSPQAVEEPAAPETTPDATTVAAEPVVAEALVLQGEPLPSDLQVAIR